MMQLAINKAWEFQTLTLPNPAVGALVIDSYGKILSLCAHQKSGGPHAEVFALQNAYAKLSQDHTILSLTDSTEIHSYLIKNHRNLFCDCKIFITLEPCATYGKTPPCAELLAHLKPKMVLIGARETYNQGGIEILKSAGVDVISGILLKECQDLLFPFYMWEQKNQFVLFKLVQRLDGDYQSGLISSHQARIFSHNQRSISQQILISKKTFLHDKPKLNARLATYPYNASYHPKVCILSRDKTPLDLSCYQNSKLCDASNAIESGFNIIEGGWDLFWALKTQIDLLLIHISPSLNSHSNPQKQLQDFKGEILHTQKIGEDVLLWIKNS